MPTTRVSYGPALLALIAFAVGFIAARLFTTIKPDVVVVSGGIHFHHFWYGLAMIVTAGWLGIATNHPAFKRVLATVFGLGGGLMADEVGLLLTFGDYYSLLTYMFVVGFTSLAVFLLLVLRFRREILLDLEGFERGEGLVHVGILVAGFSALAFAFESLSAGSLVAAAGTIIAVVGVLTRRKKRSLAP